MKTQTYKSRGIFKKYLALKGLLTILLSTISLSAATPGATGVGTRIYSTNTEILFTNSAGASFSAKGGSSASLVAAIYGFANFSPLQIATTNLDVYAGAVLYFTNIFTNYANSNSTYHFSSGANYKGATGSPWSLAFLDESLSPVSIASVAPDAPFKLVTRITVAADAENGAFAAFHITNKIISPESDRAVSYSSPLGFSYGGQSIWSDIISVEIGGPVISATKSIFVTNSAGGNIGVNDLVPGSEITYTINYTNSGSKPAYAASFTEKLATPYVIYNGVTRPTGINSADYLAAGNWGAIPVGHDSSIDGIKMVVNLIPAGAGGTLTYKVTVR